MYTYPEAARAIGITWRRLERYERDGVFQSTRIGNARCLDEDQVTHLRTLLKPEGYTAEEAAERLGRSLGAVYALVHRGRLGKRSMPGRRLVLDRMDVERLRARRRR